MDELQKLLKLLGKIRKQPDVTSCYIAPTGFVNIAGEYTDVTYGVCIIRGDTDLWLHSFGEDFMTKLKEEANGI